MPDNAAIIGARSTEHGARSTEHEPIHVIISHDVDSLYFPKGLSKRIRNCIHVKLWLRLARFVLTGKISLPHAFSVLFDASKIKLHNIEALMEFDRAHGVKPTYFFIMDQERCIHDSLGGAYPLDDAKPFIELVRSNGFEAGVHGIVFDDFDGMKSERDTWTQLTGSAPKCIRNHFVRFDDKTFERLSSLGYDYDSTEFDKAARSLIKAPYKVGNMWEFPLNIMDVYLVSPYIKQHSYLASAEEMKAKTLRIIGELKSKGIGYLTVLFHDYGFCELSRGYRDWYKWLVNYVEESPDFDFMSYREAIAHLEQKAAASH